MNENLGRAQLAQKRFVILTAIARGASAEERVVGETKLIPGLVFYR